MRKGFVTYILVALGLLAAFLFTKFKTQVSPSRDTASQDRAVAAALAKADPRIVASIASNFSAVAPMRNLPPEPQTASPAPPARAVTLEFTNLPPATVVQLLSHTMHNYGSLFGGNPVGTNPEITSALNGNNPRNVNFINAEEGMRLNQNGELVDPWGTPYFFHQLSAAEMEIHSAGPDGVMWTRDDLVIK